MTSGERILVIRLSAFGDFVLALPAMAAIRLYHPTAHITLLTTGQLRALGERSGWFDHVEIDSRPRWFQIGGWLRLRKFFRNGGFRRVYDLQSQDRTAIYFRLFGKKRPEWSGIAAGASHPHLDPNRRHMHSLDIHAAQLREAGITDIPHPDLSWLDSDVSSLAPDGKFALLVPGSAPHRPDKRWPAGSYGTLATALVQNGIIPVVLGTKDERPLADSILAACPQARDLTGRTDIFQIAGLARRAAFAVGNDTGPMHLIAMTGCPSVVLFSKASNPVRNAPRGDHVTVLQRANLADLPVETVLESVLAR